jgi:2-keto-4-pentenoate hydratase/2-oxohepta-3-ene-1,7-dioic acid hydratase in catechol pathway/regulator of RNase E activity RraA
MLATDSGPYTISCTIRAREVHVVVSPTKIVAVHISYRSRAQERGKTPAFPSYFLKPTSTVASTGDPVLRPPGCELLAFEGEIALVIGRTARRVAADDAWAHVAWVTAANDFGVYDLRYADGGSNVRSKGIDGYTPLGPELLDARTIDPDDLRIRSWVNGALAQDAHTGEELLFPLSYLVADLSHVMTLEVGDVILTGTPTGSTVVVPGDEVEVEVSTSTASSGLLRSPILEDEARLSPWSAPPKADDDVRAAAFGSRRTPETPSVADDPVAARFGAEVAVRLRSLATATIASQLRRRGIDGCTLGPLSCSRPDLRMVGFAVTLRYLPRREDLAVDHGGGMNAQKRAVETVGPGEVLVMEARGDETCGTIGDLLALRAMVRGAAGVVTDGSIRDSAAIRALALPVYHAATHPAVLSRRHVPWEVNGPISCAGVAVLPGDLMVGDADGVLVLPDGLVESVVADAWEQERQERFIAASIAAGASVDGLYPIGPDWTEAYERWAEDEAATSGARPA